MRGLKISLLFLLLVAVLFVWVFALTPPKPVAPKKVEPTAFERRCSICHTLQDVRMGMEKIIKDMHDKTGVQISEKSLKEVEATFTLLPLEEPHPGLFQEKCGKCHSLDKVVMAHQTKSEDEMIKIIERMSTKEKSGISKEETKKIHESMMMLNEIYEPDVELKKKEEKK